MTYEEKELKKQQIAAAQILKDKMSTFEKIKMLNTPYNELPKELQPGMVKHPQKFQFVRMMHPNIGEQRETFAARLLRYMDKYNLDNKRFCDVANEFAQKYNTKITLRDLNNYTNFNVCPKIDKMYAIAETMGLSIDYFAGYGPTNRKRKETKAA